MEYTPSIYFDCTSNVTPHPCRNTTILVQKFISNYPLRIKNIHMNHSKRYPRPWSILQKMLGKIGLQTFGLRSSLRSFSIILLLLLMLRSTLPNRWTTFAKQANLQNKNQCTRMEPHKRIFLRHGTTPSPKLTYLCYPTIANRTVVHNQANLWSK